MRYRNLIVALTLFLFSFGTVHAHVVVKPSETYVGAWQTFTMAVPSEKPIETVNLRLVIPEGLEYVTPNVKPGWTVVIKKQQIAGKEVVSEIEWQNGHIPAGMRDEFVFSAKVPTTTAILEWRAYQTYADGSIVSWDKAENEQPMDSSGKADFSKFGPFSKTQVIDDLSAPKVSWLTEHKIDLALGLSILAILLAIYNARRRQ